MKNVENGYRCVNMPVSVHSLVKRVSEFTGIPMSRIYADGAIYQAGVVADIHSMPVKLRVVDTGGAESQVGDGQ